MNLRSQRIAFQFIAGVFVLLAAELKAREESNSLEQQFRSLPLEARRQMGPLFWLHGDETKERLELELQKVAEGGNGCFTAESRPHTDWLGPAWYRDLGICLEAAKSNNLQMWIFDERWWPSGEAGGLVPDEHLNKYMQAVDWEVSGGQHCESQYSEHNTQIHSDKLIAVLAGKLKSGAIDGESIIDLSPTIVDGKFTWEVPAGTWRIMVFTWQLNMNRRLVDGASKNAVEWYIRTVYQPHYDHFQDDYGKTIQGYFYDEPETWGDWGTEVLPLLKERGVDWKKVLVGWKFALAGEEDMAAKYQYQDAFAEAWGRTLYGGLTQWCHDHKVLSQGHFLEHNWEYLNPRMSGGNMFQLQKYSDRGAIDAVWRQFVQGRRDMGTWQTPKIGSSISHVYGKTNDIAMIEIFGARGQDLTYTEMKWWTDHMLASGINCFIPHSFNPRAPYDNDCPPYFYNGGFEPRWPLYRVYANYTARMSLMLSGGRHVCPVAFLFLGNSKHVGEAVTPEEMTTALQDGLYDCDWMPYEVFEQNAKVAGRNLELYLEHYQVLIVPPVEVIPWQTLSKVHEFFEQGGVVIGYGWLPAKSATLGKTSSDISLLRKAIWGDAQTPGLAVCKTSPAGGRSYLLPENPTPNQIGQVLNKDAGVPPVLEVLAGETSNWVHVLHRQKEGKDIFFICNQNDKAPARQFKIRARVAGTPECWDGVRNEVTSIPYQRVDHNTTEFTLVLEPLESVLIVFQETTNRRPGRIEASSKILCEPIALVPIEKRASKNTGPSNSDDTLTRCSWVWYSENNAAKETSPGTRYLRKAVSIPDKANLTLAQAFLTADNEFALTLNGRHVGGGWEWQTIHKVNLTPYVAEGQNVLGIEAKNNGWRPGSAGVIGYLLLQYQKGDPVVIPIDKSWKVSRKLQIAWNVAGFDDSGWAPAQEVAMFGSEPWGRVATPMTISPVKADPFNGHVTIPDNADLSGMRVYLEADSLVPEEAASVTVNGHYAGGFIGRPLHLDVTEFITKGTNSFLIQPFTPKQARLSFYAK